MKTIFLVTADGTYIGAFSGDVGGLPAGIEVPTAPQDARQIWQFPGWSPVPVTVPQEVTRFQARAALYQAGWLDEVEALIAAPETDRMLVLAWQDALTFKRQSPCVQAMAQQLGLSEPQLDGLFITAAGIE